METTIKNEKKLMEDYIEKRNRYEELKKQATAAKEEYDQALSDLAAHMIESGKKSLNFQGVGTVTLLEPIIRANVLKENQELLLNFVREIGRGECIKESIHHSTLGTLIKELLSQGKALPEYIGYYLEPSIRLMKE